jgi:ATP citrate (pro-S)-lyase
MKISDVFKSNLGVGGVVGLIWFRKRLPDYFCRFIEMVLMVTADHGPAVAGACRILCYSRLSERASVFRAGAHNTIVCARAGKDLVSSLVSGLLTIGPRFGGALDGTRMAMFVLTSHLHLCRRAQMPLSSSRELTTTA